MAGVSVAYIEIGYLWRTVLVEPCGASCGSRFFVPPRFFVLAGGDCCFAYLERMSRVLPWCIRQPGYGLRGTW